MLQSNSKNSSICSVKFIIIFTIIIIILCIIQFITQNQKIYNNIFYGAFLKTRTCENGNKNYSELNKNICNATYTQSKTISELNRTYSFGDNIFSRLESRFLGENNSLETTVKCIGPLRNQSCLYKNLYYINSTFMILIVKGTILPVLDVRVYSFRSETISPRRYEFESYLKLEKFVRYSIDPVVIPGVTLFLSFPWLRNIGHSLFDALYPAYVALIRFPPRHLRPFRLLCAIDECQTCSHEEIFHRFAGLGIIKHYVLNDMSNENWFVFDELVMGGGMMCQRCTQSNFQLPGGVELDGSRLFRDRIYTQHGILPPIRRQKHSAEGRNSNNILRAYIIDNKRYTKTDRKEINAAINEINNYTTIHIIQNISNMSKLEWPLINISYLHYGHVKNRKKQSSRFNATRVDVRSPTYELKENRFMAQLRLMRTMDIHITGPGTGQMYQTFLPDGSVVINVGGLQPLKPEYQNITYTTYLEQYMVSGAPYLKGLYYPINERPKGIKKDNLVKLIQEAAKIIMKGFSIPVNPIESLAPDGKLFIEMCAKDKQFCELVTSRASGTNFGCYHFWIDEVIHERGPWKEINGDKKMLCPFNRTLMRQLRDKYNIHHYYIPLNQSKLSS